jgi:hypothetical protein
MYGNHQRDADMDDMGDVDDTRGGVYGNHQRDADMGDADDVDDMDDDDEFADSVVGDILSNWRLIVGGVVLALAAYILGPLLGPVADLFKMAFGTAVGSVAFLADNPWLIPLIGLLSLIAPVVMRRIAKARNGALPEADMARAIGNSNARAHGMNRSGDYAAAGRPLRAAGTDPAEVQRAVAESAMHGAALEQNGLGVLSAETAERVHRLAIGVPLRNARPDTMDPLVFEFVQKLHARVKGTADNKDFVSDIRADPIPGPNPNPVPRPPMQPPGTPMPPQGPITPGMSRPVGGGAGSAHRR